MNALALSDAVLALVCLGVAAAWVRMSARRASLPLLIAGWTLLAAAAVLGTLRFGGGFDGVLAAHRALSTLAAGFGLPAIAVGVGIALWKPDAVTATGVVVLLVLAAIHGIATAFDSARIIGAAIVLPAALLVALRPALPTRARIAAVLALASVVMSGVFARQAPGSAPHLTALHHALAALQLAWFAVLYAAAPRR